MWGLAHLHKTNIPKRYACRFSQAQDLYIALSWVMEFSSETSKSGKARPSQLVASGDDKKKKKKKNEKKRRSLSFQGHATHVYMYM